MNLLRVWGGGLIEKEAFYDLCDRLGILVWQEFIQSSSGIDNRPPEDPGFHRDAVCGRPPDHPARRNHPSLAVWCGGNELNSGQERPLDEATQRSPAARDGPAAGSRPALGADFTFRASVGYSLRKVAGRSAGAA